MCCFQMGIACRGMGGEDVKACSDGFFHVQMDNFVFFFVFFKGGGRRPVRARMVCAFLAMPKNRWKNYGRKKCSTGGGESKAIWAMPIWKQHISKRAPLRGMTMTLDMSKVFTTLVQVVTSSRQNSPSCSPNLDSSPGAKRSRWYTPLSSTYNVIELLCQASQYEKN